MSEDELRPDGLALLVSIVPYLRERGAPVPVRELAERFRTTPAEVRRLVRLVAVSGSPGETGAYLDGDLFDIDWDALDERDEVDVTRFVALERPPRLSTREVAALLAGLGVIASVPGVDAEAVARLSAKLSGTAPAEARGALRPAALGPAAAAPEEADALARAIAGGRRVAFDYRSPASGPSSRRVDPQRLDALDGEWYLRGWCLDAGEHRSFRLDRMRRLRVLDERAEPRPEDAGGLYSPGRHDAEATLLVAEAALPEALEFLPPGARVPAPEADGRRRLVVRASSWDRLVRLAASHAGLIEVAGPPSARAAVRAWARAGLEALGAAPPIA